MRLHDDVAMNRRTRVVAMRLDHGQLQGSLKGLGWAALKDMHAMQG